ncbi:MAG: hypothetical protein ABW186_07820 [Rhodanobacteraceae bacterium]
MLITFAKQPTDDGKTARDVVRVAAWVLSEKYRNCAAEVLAFSEDGSSVTVGLSMSPETNSVECFEWFTQFLADHSLTLVRDRHFERALRQIRE